jgi:hypothetical protein
VITAAHIIDPVARTRHQLDSRSHLASRSHRALALTRLMATSLFGPHRHRPSHIRSRRSPVDTRSPGSNLHASPPCNTSRSASGPKVRITTASPKPVAGPSTMARAFRPRLFSPRHGDLSFSSRWVVFSPRPSLNWPSRPERPGIFLAVAFWHARSRRGGIVATNPNISPTRWTRRRLFPLLTERTKRTLSR